MWALKPDKDSSHWLWSPNRGKKWYRVKMMNVYPRTVRDFIYHLFVTNQVKFVIADMEYFKSDRSLGIIIGEKKPEKGSKGKQVNLESFIPSRNNSPSKNVGV